VPLVDRHALKRANWIIGHGKAVWKIKHAHNQAAVYLRALLKRIHIATKNRVCSKKLYKIARRWANREREDGNARALMRGTLLQDDEQIEQQNKRDKIKSSIEKARRLLIDLTRSNRLLHSTRTGARPHCLDIVGTTADDLATTLMWAATQHRFLADEEEPEAKTIKSLRTLLDLERLNKRLTKFYRESRTFEEEQGVNILFIALGFLEYFEDPRAQEACSAPLILIPVSLERQKTGAYRMQRRDEDLTVNVALREKLKQIASIELPDLPSDEDWKPSTYFKKISEVISRQTSWSVDCDAIGLGFFSFSKFLMWRDLTPTSWPGNSLLENLLVQTLLGENARFTPEPPIVEDSERIDDKIDITVQRNVVDCDSSQATAIAEAISGRHLVIQGPPGTGKSQTIVNILASTAAAGKRVLFIAEKLAALEVVNDRLNKAGLGILTLELHSRKASKTAVLSSISVAMNKSDFGIELGQDLAPTIRADIQKLNRWTDAIHTHIGESGHSVYEIMGASQLTRLEAARLGESRIARDDWTHDQIREAIELAELTARRLGRVGEPKAHPWYEAQGPILAPFDITRLTSALDDSITACETLFELGNVAAALAASNAPRSVREIRSTRELLHRITTVPELGSPNLAHPAWASDLIRIEKLIDIFVKLRNGKEAARELVIDAAWSEDLATLRRAIAAHGQNLLRIFNRPYKDALAKLRGLSAKPIPKGYGARVAFLDHLVGLQEAERIFTAEIEFFKAILGTLWRGSDTEIERVRAIAQWVRTYTQYGDITQILGRAALLTDRQYISSVIEKLDYALGRLSNNLKSIEEKAEPSFSAAIGNADWTLANLDTLLRVLREWQSSVGRYNDWVTLRESFRELSQIGLGAVERLVVDKGLDPNDLGKAAHGLIIEALWNRAVKEIPELINIEGSERIDTVARFRDLDKKNLERSRRQILADYLQKRPSLNALGEMGILRDELGRQRGRKPVRKLMESAGRAIQQLKPIFLMSPLSVAQFLPPSTLEFDLIVIDEASQVAPEDALGAIARAKQMVVVGDDKQLPPTNFFKLAIAEDEENDGEGANVANYESILSMASSRGVSSRMLRWHYRSKHPSLIALSNASCYADNLLLPPSPILSNEELGLRLIRTPANSYDRGNTGRNDPEAREIAKAVALHLQEYPDLSLGIGCFSVAQRNAIDDALHELKLRSTTDIFEPKAERFFVKNLEAIQGDERDVIFISVGYGRDSQGRFFNNFGPVSAEGGERRLNVLISRARIRCVVFSSIDSGDIEESMHPGPQMLRDFLHFADTGHIAAGNITGADFDSPFEKSVSDVLRTNGYKVANQVGVGGFKVDLAVHAPAHEGRFAIGIECDGATYHSSRSARDRDRLRQEILEGMGWKLHRIWSTDWFRHPDREANRLLKVVKEACAEPPKPIVPPSPPSPSTTQPDLDPESVVVTAPPPAPAMVGRPYQVVHLPKQTVMFESADPNLLARLAAIVVETEGPVLTDRVARRIRTAFGLKRTGNQVRGRIEEALKVAETLGRVVQVHPGFWDKANRTNPIVRNHKECGEQPLDPADICPTEYRQGIVDLLGSTINAHRDELIIAVTRLLGFERTGPGLRAAIESQINGMLAANRLIEMDGMLSLVRSA
jgi:very-short-patch-repair endonuclease